MLADSRTKVYFKFYQFIFNKLTEEYQVAQFLMSYGNNVQNLKL